MQTTDHADARLKKGEARRQAIIQAALELIRERGAHSLTLDAVAEHAGVSKGGLTHHFSTKEALVRGVFDSAVEVLHQQIESAYERTDHSAGSFTRAYIDTTLRHAEEGYLLPLFELVAADPKMAGSMAKHNAWCHAHLENDGIDPVLAHVLASASDGLWLELIFGLESPNSWRVRAMRSYMLDLSRENTPAR